MQTKILTLIMVALTVFIFGINPVMGQNKNVADTTKQVSAIYTCTMHPEIQSNQPGACPKCGMELKKSETLEKRPKKQKMKMMCPMMSDMENMENDNSAVKNKIVNDSSPKDAILYTCSLHPEIELNQPGYCLKCGMALIKKSAALEKKARRHKMSRMGIGVGMGIMMAGMLLFVMKR